MDMKRMKDKIAENASNGKFHTLAVFAFLAAIVLTNQWGHPAATGLYYAAALLCAFLGLFPNLKKMEISWKVVVFAAVVAVTGLLNIALVGNSTAFKQLFTLVSIGIASSFWHKSLDDRALLAIILLNAAVVAVRMIVFGQEGPIYLSSSTNFVSVHMLLPAVLYYAVREQQGKKLILWPAGVVWLMCLLARGRGGILFSTFFLGGLVFVWFCKAFMKMSKRNRIILCVALGLVVVAAVVLAMALDLVHRIGCLARFAENGLSDNGRFLIWGEFFPAVTASAKNLLLGPDLSTLVWASKMHGNLHNSFLNIQAYNGIVTVVMVLMAMFWAAWYGLKNKKWIYLVCMATFYLRGATDYIFWGSFGTPVFLFLLLPALEQEGCKKLVVDIPLILGKLLPGKKK